HELSALEQAIGEDGTIWDQRAIRLHAGFHLPFAQGGYWLEEQPWPLAWRNINAPPVTVLESFGVFAALHNGLITPADGSHYQELLKTLHTHLPELLGGEAPIRLALGGYEPELRREVDPPVPLWMLDSGAPWITGLAVPVYAVADYPNDAQTTL